MVGQYRSSECNGSLEFKYARVVVCMQKTVPRSSRTERTRERSIQKWSGCLRDENPAVERNNKNRRDRSCHVVLCKNGAPLVTIILLKYMIRQVFLIVGGFLATVHAQAFVLLGTRDRNVKWILKNSLDSAVLRSGRRNLIFLCWPCASWHLSFLWMSRSFMRYILLC